MVSALTRYRVFQIPLSAEAFTLSGLTDRAIALLAIFAIKQVPVMTMCPQSILSGNRVSVYEGVLPHGDYAKVHDIDAVSILADVIDHHAGGNWALKDEVGHSVSTTVLTAKIEGSIAVFIKRTLPKVTSIVLYPFAIKPVNFLLVNHLALNVPFAPLGYKREI